MKRVLVVLMVLAAVGGWATGNKESAGVSLSLAIEKDWKVESNQLMYYEEYIVKEFTEKTGIEVDIVPVNSDDNTTKRLDAMIQAGLMPNVYTDYSGRVGIFVAKGQAVVPLDSYLPKQVLEQYFPSYLKIFGKDGHVYALPTTSWSTTGHVNIDAFRKAGMGDVLSDGMLTYDEVAEAARKLKADGYYATALFANQAGGDYWIYTFWLSGHGARLYRDDGSIAIGDPEAVAALKLMKAWYDEGLLPFGAAGLGPGDYIGLSQSGKALAFSYGWQNQAGLTFEDIHTEAPRLPGVEKVPVATGVDAVLAFDTGSKATIEAAVSLVEHIASAKYQAFRVADSGRFPSMYGVDIPEAANPNFVLAIDVLERNGVLDMGIGKPYYQEMRNLWAAMIQAILTDELTVEDAVARYVREGNAAIDSYR